jgi:hypothetical protein
LEGVDDLPEEGDEPEAGELPLEGELLTPDLLPEFP